VQAEPESVDVAALTTISIFFLSAARPCTASATEDEVRSAVLVVGVNEFDLLAATAEILDRHFHGFDRPLAAKIAVGSGLIVEDADLDALR